ncbi:MAG TPA: SGNH/GDSL hydrolase family protein [Accumulibacter sp.]|nr:SGNH/GDSL hydrolase family protein [Accumulibacter sp.]HNC18355.1 SGNH/GDSL hydrolase family protein [Accumulibacter sp.]HND80621.1 SGNH/GDSL hydrolase family protein [Accumulibacter sp.]HNH24619.1 SGNH/GDSL hydrolase family protein [Accumulibacter sp.]HNM75204.1 SGNH/GDSL hydrolase family protein [Accumulibacter sp.]
MSSVSLALTLGLSSTAHASLQQLSNLFVFGDSLSDGGNSGLLTQAATGGAYTFPPAPYAGGRYSNGPVAVEQLWQLYNPGDTSFKPSLAGGTNYAIGGATSGLENYNSVNPSTGGLAPIFGQKGNAWQLATFAAQNPTFDPATSLFVVWLFPNDVFNWSVTGQLPGTAVGAPGSAGDVSALIGNGINNIIATVTFLAAHGGRHFLVPNMPNLSLTPAFAGSPDLNNLSNAFDANLALALSGLQAAVPSIEIVQFDTNAAFQNLITNKAAYGLTDTSTACLSSPTCDPNTWLFWDGVHPTAKGHALLAAQFKAAIPEPSSIVLLMTSLLMFTFGVAQRRSQRP